MFVALERNPERPRHIGRASFQPDRPPLGGDLGHPEVILFGEGLDPLDSGRVGAVRGGEFFPRNGGFARAMCLDARLSV